MPDPEYQPCACANCSWTGDTSGAGEIRDFWSRVQPGDTMPAGECEECGCLVYLVAADTLAQPITIYLNLAGGESASDHVLAVHADYVRLTALAGVARENHLDTVALRPTYALSSYEAIPDPRVDGFVGDEAAIELSSCPTEEFERSAEPTIRLGSVVLHVGADGVCFAVASAKHTDRSYSTEAFDLKAVATYLESRSAAPSAEAA